MRIKPNENPCQGVADLPMVRQDGDRLPMLLDVQRCAFCAHLSPISTFSGWCSEHGLPMPNSAGACERFKTKGDHG